MVRRWRPALQKSWHRRRSLKTQISFMFLLGVFPLCFHLPSFTWDDLLENISSTIFNIHLLFDYPKGKLSPCFIISNVLFTTETTQSNLQIKALLFQPKVIKVLYRGEQAMKVPPALWGHTEGCSRAPTQLAMPHLCPIRKCYVICTLSKPK